MTMDTDDRLEAKYVSVPNGKHRAILLRRHASLLASGGELDRDGRWIKGGDPTCTLLPDGTLPLSKTEIKIVRSRLDSLPVKDQMPWLKTMTSTPRSG